MNELLTFGLEWVATRYAVDPVADRVTRRARGMLERAQRLGRDRLSFDERTAMRALQEVAWTDDALVSDYLGGVVAGGEPDGGGVSAAAQVGRLSSLQLRLHYVVYRQLYFSEHQGHGQTDLRSHRDVANNLELYLSRDDLVSAFGLETDGEGVRQLLGALHVLAREDLIRAHSDHGPTDLRPSSTAYDVQEAWRLAELRSRAFPYAALICRPTPSGIELFLRGCGESRHDPAYIREMSGELIQADVAEVQGGLINDLPRT